MSTPDMWRTRSSSSISAWKRFWRGRTGKAAAKLHEAGLEQAVEFEECAAARFRLHQRRVEPMPRRPVRVKTFRHDFLLGPGGFHRFVVLLFLLIDFLSFLWRLSFSIAALRLALAWIDCAWL
jgi:hypothetical protein